MALLKQGYEEWDVAVECKRVGGSGDRVDPEPEAGGFIVSELSTKTIQNSLALPGRGLGSG